MVMPVTSSNDVQAARKPKSTKGSWNWVSMS